MEASINHVIPIFFSVLEILVHKFPFSTALVEWDRFWYIMFSFFILFLSLHSFSPSAKSFDSGSSSFHSYHIKSISKWKFISSRSKDTVKRLLMSLTTKFLSLTACWLAVGTQTWSWVHHKRGSAERSILPVLFTLMSRQTFAKQCVWEAEYCLGCELCIRHAHLLL